MTLDVNGDENLAIAQEQLEQLLVPGEQLEAVSPQIRLFALTHRRALVAATTGRFIALTRGLFGGYTPIDVRWQDLKDAKLSVGIFGASLVIYASSATDLAMSGRLVGGIVFTGLEKTSAQEIYRICQAQEQAWREKRRVRELEELRAKSGGIQLGSNLSSSGGAPDGGDPVQRLAKAKEMLQRGLISDSEFEAMKARIISSI